MLALLGLRSPSNEGFREGFEPEPALTVSEWADAYRILSAKASVEAGTWRTSRTPYLREIMDTLSAHSPVLRVAFMKGVQIGATEVGLNWIGYVIHNAPGPFLMVQPTDEMAGTVSKARIAPMIEATPALKNRVAEPRSRDSGNTIFAKDFNGGTLYMAGSNSPAKLASRPIRYLFVDEVDRLSGQTGDEGDPIALAERRTDTYKYLRKVFMASSPTVRKFSRIEAEFQKGDQRYYFVPCPHCAAMDWIRWPNIRWEEGKPETAALVCESCGGTIHERLKPELLERGEWRPTAEGNGVTRSYHLSALYSPWVTWGDIAAEFAAVEKDPPRFQVWVNTRLGETWEDRAEAADPDSLYARREDYPADVPHGVGILVAGVDVQKDRLEVAVKGYGAGMESWLIDWQAFLGDTLTDTPWSELDRYLRRAFIHESGQKAWIQYCLIDSGYNTQKVYQFCRARFARRIYPCKGSNQVGETIIVGRPRKRRDFQTNLYMICTDEAKTQIYKRLRIKGGGIGAMHFPSTVDREYFDQLTAETKVRKKVQGRIKEVWEKTRERNEALDLEVMCLAALSVPGPELVRMLPQKAKALSLPPEDPKPEPTEPQKLRPALQRPRPRGSSWVNRFRR